MDDAAVKTALTIFGAILGALIAGAANAYAARQKIREVEIAYGHKLRDGYLENARKMAEDVYLPINIALTTLSKSFDQFRARVDFDNKSAPIGAQNRFIASIRAYLKEIDGLFALGADAYLTNELDAAIRRFNSFLSESLDEDSVRYKVLLEATIRIPFFGYISAAPIKARIDSKGLPAKIPSLSATMAGASISYEREIVGAAPATREFEQRFQIEFAEIKALIKEVILGSQLATR